MTGIRNIFLWLPLRKGSPKGESVSFQSFSNNGNVDNNSFTIVKESSLTDKVIEKNNYQQFSTVDEKKCFMKWQFVTIFTILLSFIFLLIVYFYCFYLINGNGQQENVMGARDYILFPEDTNNLLDFPHPANSNQCLQVSESEKFDCYPEDGADKEKCELRGCCWLENNKNDSQLPPLNVPYCYYPDNFQSYVYINITQSSYGVEAFLKRVFKSPYPEDVKILKMVVRFETDTLIRVKFTDPFHDRFESPYPELPVFDKHPTNLSYNLVLDPTKVGFKVVRKSDGTVLFDSQGIENFIFANQFIQISSKLPSNYIYGLGEHRAPLLLPINWQRFVLFNHDNIPMENKNLYGSHPFYLLMENSGKSHGVFLLNSHAIEIILQPTPAITFRTLGGIIDLYFFMGPSPYDVINQYTEIIGRPALPPYWGLGFHFCRFGFKTLNRTRQVMERIIKVGIPLDTQWNDLDYMNNSNVFTYDRRNFGDLPKFVEELHERGMHYIPLIDPGISASEKLGTYPPYDVGIKMDIFVKNSTNQPFVGKVWNSVSTVWPDFLNPNVINYWLEMLKSTHKLFEFDGAWIDMNEPSNFLSGSFDGCPNDTLNSPPYSPPFDGRLIYYKTICMSANHRNAKHYQVHNLFGLAEAIATNFALKEIRGKRPMIISRSSYPGLGRYAGHWSGDVVSDWYDMKYTIPDLLSFSMFGVPLMGADICGFNGNTTAALCNRWMQLGAFYPFSRNHNTDDGIDQDPVALGPLVVESSKKALKVRYSLLPYLYTLFWKAHISGTTVATPMFFEFPEDKKTYSEDEMFLWGRAILIIPVLKENVVTVCPYLPKSIWYDFYTRKSLESKGEYFNLSAPLDTIPVLIRGGNVIPLQEPLTTTTAARKTKLQLIVAPDEEGLADGQFYWDDGDSLNTVEEKRYSLINFTLKFKTLTIQPEFLSTEEIPPNLGKITVLRVNYPIDKVYVDKNRIDFKINKTNEFMELDDLDINLKSKIVVDWF